MDVNKFFSFYRSFNRRWQTSLIPWLMTGALLTLPFAVNAVDLNGEWVGEGYKCGFKTSQETVTIAQKGNSVDATKITGDNCVPAGTRTFVGTLNGEKIQATWTTGTANKPACCQKKGHLIIVDDNTLKSSVGITYKRRVSEKQPQPQTNLNDGLVAHYLFDGNAEDASGNGNHGAIKGTLTFQPGVDGLAANFDGSNSVIV